MAARTYLVTGAAGFIGSHLAEALLRRGDLVVGLDDFNDFYDPRLKRENAAALGRSPGFELVETDIRDRGALFDLVPGRRYDAIVHLAAMAGVRPSIADPGLYAGVNVSGTVNVLDLALRLGVKKVVFASSSSVYGANRKVPFSEEDRVDNPVSPYAATKKAGELIAHAYHHVHGLDVTCLRFFTVYGPRQRPEMAVHLFTRLIEEGKPVPVFGDGTTRRDYTYIDDITDGVVRSIDRFCGYRIYNLGESRTVELREMIRCLETALGRRAVIDRRPEQPGDVPVTYADVTLARRELGYEPKTPFEEGARRFVEWYRDPGRRKAEP